MKNILLSPYASERPFDWNGHFANGRPLCLEIGFGQGESLLTSIDEQPQFNYIGAEIDWTRIRKCLKSIQRLSLAKKQAAETQIRVLKSDVWVLLERFIRERTLARAACFFPCPWPKDCHEKHRLFSHDFLGLLNSRLAGGGEVLLVTDYEPYAQWVLDQSAGTGFDVSRRMIGGRLRTKFERKWQAAGQQEFFEITFNKKSHVCRPLKEDVVLKASYHAEFNPERIKFNEYVSKGLAVIPKDWIYDQVRQKGLARLVVSEEHLTQHVWIVIINTKKGWGVLCAEGQQVLPTKGVARAIEMVSLAVEETRKSRH
ncbi:MAG: hypothetical protein AB1650_09685 [Candidatus Omnitrophota bacterium]